MPEMKKLILSAIVAAGTALAGFAMDPDQHPALSLRGNPDNSAAPTVILKDSKGFMRRLHMPETNVAASGAPARLAAPKADTHSQVIKGSLIYSAQWPTGVSRWGMYAMPATGGELIPLTGEETYDKLDYLANAGATSMGDGYYYICTYAWRTSGMQEEITAIQGTIFDSNTWQPISYKGFSTTDGKPDEAYLTTSMAYDKSTGKIYGSFYGYDEDLYTFGILDAQEFKLQSVALMEEPWNACSFDKDGNLYAILENGDLCLVNKRSGETTLINNTGLACPYQTSGTINPEDNKFYYIFVSQKGSILYAIDLATAEAEPVYDFTYGVQLGGMYFSAPDPSLLAPAAVKDASVAFNGTLEGTLEFTLPTTTLSGDPLTGEVEYIVTMDYAEYKTGKGNAGDHISVEVKAETTGTHYFDIVCLNEEGRGSAANCSGFAGEKPGLPLAARNFKVVEDPEHWGRLTMTWDAPETDSNGRPINPDDVAYWICDNQIYSWCKDYHGNSLVVDMGDLSKKQKFDDFLLISGINIDGQYAYNWDREGYTTTRARSFGRPYDLPWKERVTYNGLDWNWVMISSPNLGHWHYWDGVETELVKVVPYGDDGGMFLADADIDNALLELRGGKVDLGNAENPVLTFRIYRHPTFSNDYVAAYIFEADEQESDFYRLFSTTAETPEEEGWYECVVPLTDFRTKTIQVAFVAVCSKTSSLVAIDEVEIRNCRDNDMGVTDFSAPASLVPGKKVDFGVTVRNWGTTEVASCMVNLVRNGEIVSAQEVNGILAGESRKIVFDELPTPLFSGTCDYYAEVVLPGDEDDDNNRSRTITIEVMHNEFPSPEALEANTAGDDVVLTWEEPYLKPVETVTESFEDEDYDDWTANGFESYVDESVAPHFGDRMLASIPEEGNFGIHTIILPRLSGNAQKVTFYARSLNSDNRASVDILASSDGTAMEDFTPVGSKSKIAAFWTKVEADLPEGTQYFALSHDATNEDSGSLLIDDVTYECHGFDDLILNGYNIYLNGMLLNDKPYEENEFVAENGAVAGGVYHVTAVYEQGESRACAPVVIEGSGVNSAEADHVAVSVADGVINVAGCRGYINVYSVDGHMVANAASKGHDSFRVAPGLYIVVADGQSVKVTVK